MKITPQWVNEVSFVIQAGGKSVRMGTDKGLILLAGKPLVSWILDRIIGIGGDVLIISNSLDNYRKFNTPVYPDILPGIGALGGLHTALFYATRDLVYVLACDMPFIHTCMLENIVKVSTNFDVVIPRLEGNKLEPFRALYRKSTCLNSINKAIANNKRRMISFFDDVKVKYYNFEDYRKFDPDLISFINVNTPEELSIAEVLSTSLPDGFL